MTVGTVISNTINKIRKVIITTLGGTLTRTPIEISPFGIDTCPIPGMVAIYTDTIGNQTPILAGYFNISALAQPGENRQYCTDAQGNIKFYTWMKADGTMMIGGDADFAVGYTNLNSLLQTQAQNINSQLALIASGITAAGGSYTPVDLSTDFTSIKKQQIKTI